MNFTKFGEEGIRHLLCKSPGLKINDRIVLGRKNKWIKIKKWIELVGTECLDCPNVEGGVLGEFKT